MSAWKTLKYIFVDFPSLFSHFHLFLPIFPSALMPHISITRTFSPIYYSDEWVSWCVCALFCVFALLLLSWWYVHKKTQLRVELSYKFYNKFSFYIIFSFIFFYSSTSRASHPFGRTYIFNSIPFRPYISSFYNQFLLIRNGHDDFTFSFIFPLISSSPSTHCWTVYGTGWRLLGAQSFFLITKEYTVLEIHNLFKNERGVPFDSSPK